MSRFVKGPEVALFMLASLAATPYCWWANAFVMVRVWQWYQADWMPALTFKTALGVSFVVTLLRPVGDGDDKNKDDPARSGKHWGWLIGVCLAPWVLLAAARVCKFVFFE